MTVIQLNRRRWRVALLLCSLVFAAYFGFVLLIAFDRAALAVQLVPGLSLGMLLGALIIIGAWLCTWVYARWAARHLQPALEQLRESARQEAALDRRPHGVRP